MRGLVGGLRVSFSFCSRFLLPSSLPILFPFSFPFSLHSPPPSHYPPPSLLSLLLGVFGEAEGGVNQSLDRDLDWADSGQAHCWESTRPPTAGTVARQPTSPTGGTCRSSSSGIKGTSSTGEEDEWPLLCDTALCTVQKAVPEKKASHSGAKSTLNSGANKQIASRLSTPTPRAQQKAGPEHLPLSSP